MKKVLGVGSALLDLLIQLDDDHLLHELELPKGSMILVDFDKKEHIDAKTKHLERSIVSGGSAANTIHGLAALGIETGFMGTVGTDNNGDLFIEDLEKNNIKPLLIRSKTPSGIASTLISKDSERTFGTYLGASIELSHEDFSTDHFKGFNILHVEGYIVQNHELLETVLRLAKQTGLMVSIDMASYNVVEENLEFLQQMVKQYVDIIFANEEEAKAFTGKMPEEALHEMAAYTDVAVVKIGSKGSLARQGNEFTRIEPLKTEAIDTTGAGDVYAAGFLYGLINNAGLEKSGYYGTLLASQVISHLGAKIPSNKWSEVLQKVRA